METLEAIRERRAVRHYKPRPVPTADLLQILEAGRAAPSAKNRQPRAFVVVHDPEQLPRLAAACGRQKWILDVPCIVVGVGLPEVNPEWYRVDTAIAIQNMALAARSLGYGSCWIGNFVQEEVKAICDIPAEAEVIACLALGVPEEWPRPRERKAFDETCFAGQYGRPFGSTRRDAPR